MKAKLIHVVKNHYGNIMFSTIGLYKNNPERTTFSASPPSGDDDLSRFREAGYYASCFPEGDGIVFDPLKGQSHDQIEKDVTEILKLEIIEVRNRK